MIRCILKSTAGFFILCSIIWALVIVLLHGDYTYTERPAPSSVKNASARKEFNKTGAVLAVTRELYLSLMEKAAHSNEKAHIYQNIGSIYFDMYKATGIRRVFDSTEHYFRKSIDTQPDNKRFRHNLNRLYQVQKEFKHLTETGRSRE